MKKWILACALCILAFSGLSAAERVIHLFLIGPGLVGKELLTQIRHNFSASHPTQICVVGLADSRRMYFDPHGIDLLEWEGKLAQSEQAMSLDAFIAEMSLLQLPHSVFVDCTSSLSVADTYQAILQLGVPVVTPNKKANSSSFSSYCMLKRVARENGVRFLYDANVGAGLPMIQTVQSLSRSGDKIVKLEAILSGTLSYLFNVFDGSVPFSQVLREAQEKGYTEPDPRDDLNGMDMARKFLILARESGLELEMDDVAIERFLPQECFEAPTVAQFYDQLAHFDEEFTARVTQAASRGKVLRFIGTMEEGQIVLSLKAIGSDHPFFSLSDTDNIASMTSRNYSKNPIVIKGPGAGATVTAASVLSNVIQATDRESF